MKQIRIEMNDESFLFYQRIAGVLDCSTEKVIADYLTGLSEILIRRLTGKDDESQ